MLHDNCVSSIVFDYTGHGASSPHGTIGRMKKDGEAAYAALVAQFPNSRRCVMSFSMGAGPMLEAINRFSPAPDCVIVTSAFSSLRDWTVSFAHAPRWSTYLFADLWNNVENVKNVRSPILVMHSRADHVNAFLMGEKIFVAAPEPKHFAALDAFRHNDSYRSPGIGWWGPVIGFARFGMVEQNPPPSTQ